MRAPVSNDDEDFKVVTLPVDYYPLCTCSSLHSSLITRRHICTLKCISLSEKVKDVSLIHPYWTLSNRPFFSTELFQLQHIIDNSKVYMNINKDDSDRISMMVVTKIPMYLYKTTKLIRIILQLLHTTGKGLIYDA